jgi:hypothetical protein
VEDLIEILVLTPEDNSNYDEFHLMAADQMVDRDKVNINRWLHLQLDAVVHLNPKLSTVLPLLEQLSGSLVKGLFMGDEGINLQISDFPGKTI